MILLLRNLRTILQTFNCSNRKKLCNVRSEYGKDKVAERPLKFRPSTLLRPEGNQEWNTTGSNTFKDHGLLNRPSKAKAATDNLKASEGDTEWNDKRNEYKVYESGSRVVKAKGQNDNLRCDDAQFCACRLHIHSCK